MAFIFFLEATFLWVDFFALWAEAAGADMVAAGADAAGAEVAGAVCAKAVPDTARVRAEANARVRENLEDREAMFVNP